MRDTDLAWFAGFFDGEGCVRGRSYWRNMKDGKRRHSTCISLVVTQRDREPLDRIRELVGLGAITAKTGTPTPAFHWVVGGHNQVAEVIRLILPYSVVKRPQMELAMEIMARCTFRFGRGKLLPQSELDERLRLVKRLSDLKRSSQVFSGNEPRSRTRQPLLSPNP